MAPPEMAAGFIEGADSLPGILTSLNNKSLFEEWINFLHTPIEDETFGDDQFELRDGFLEALINSCGGDARDGGECYLILARLVELQCHAEDGPILFAREFIENISESMLTSLSGSAMEDNLALVEGAAALLRALLLPNRPRNEVDISSLRECIVLPASKSLNNNMSAGLLAEILCESVVDGVKHSVPIGEGEGISEEVSMRRETAALTKLQDWREVIENLGKFCVAQLNAAAGEKTNAEAGEQSEGERVVAAIRKIYAVAPFAVESQLETLLDEDATIILSQFGSTKAEVQDEVMVDAGEELPPLYSNISGLPIHLNGAALEHELSEIHEKLSNTDAERWDERLAALQDLERILAAGLDNADQHFFIEKIRKMPLPEQFCDLRSQVTAMACRVLICTSFEYRSFTAESSSLVSPLQQFIEYCLPALMKLCTSGTRLMATQGINCLFALCATTTSHPRLLSILCEEILDKKSKNNNRKKGAVMGLTAALRVWNEHCFKNVDLIAQAVKEANSNRDPGVREEARKCYWAMVSCSKTAAKAEHMYASSSRELKNLVKVREEFDAEWLEEGRLAYLVTSGVLLEESKKKAGGKANAPPRASNPNKRPASAPQRSTPVAKSSRFATPAKTPLATVASSSKRPSSANMPINTPGFILPMNTPSSKRRATLSAASATRSSGLKTPSIKSERKSMNSVKTNSTMKAKRTPSQIPSADIIQSTLHPDLILSSSEIQIGEENPPRTPLANISSPKIGTPVVSLLARPSPLSIEKCRGKNVLNQVVDMLSDVHNPSEQYLGIQVLALFAKDNSNHDSWNEMFTTVLDILLSEIRKTQSDPGYESLHFVRSPSKNLGDRYEAQHLFLQGIRSLLQFVPGRFGDEQIKDVMICLLEVGTFELQCLECEALSKVSSLLFSVHQCSI
jgi:hypothetical protein